MKKITLIFTAALAIIISIIFCQGCSKNDRESKTPAKLKIAGIVFQEDQFFRLFQFGMKQAAEKADIELLIANCNNKPDKEIQLVNTYIARKVDAIIISPLSEKASVAALNRAHKAGIKIITYNTTIQGEAPSTYIESKQFDLGAQTGRTARKYINEKLNGQAKIAILAFKSLLPEQSNARSEGFKQQIIDLPGIKVVAEQDAWLPEMAIKKAGDILTANPDVDIIWTANEGGTVGAVLAVKNAGRAGKTVVFGTDTSKQLTDFLLSEDNILQAITGQRPFEMGVMAVESAQKILNNGIVEKTVSVPGLLLSRQDPDTVRAFQSRLMELIARD